MNIDKLHKIIEELRTLELAVTEEKLFEKAVDIYLFDEGEFNKDKRTNLINERKSVSKENKDNLATEKQIGILQKNKMKLDYNTLSRFEATKLIGELFERQKSKESENVF